MSWDEVRHCLDSLTHSDFFETYCDAARQRRVCTGNCEQVAANEIPSAMILPRNGASMRKMIFCVRFLALFTSIVSAQQYDLVL
jgi:esterase/lipase superfamily enzyme